MIELILGGARSGKSSLAEARAAALENKITYIATAEALDNEMRLRIAHHQQARPRQWHLIEEPLKLSEALKKYCTKDACVLVDCLTLWISNHMYKNEDQWDDTQQKFIHTLQNIPGTIILVSNEVGHGVVSENELARRFVDHSGWLHQRIAEIADNVIFVTAGIPQVLKGSL